VISCLRRAGVDVLEHHVSVWEGRRQSWRAGLRVGVRLAAAEGRLLASALPAVDAVIVGYPGHLDVPVARLRARGRPVVFNPLVALADTLVTDRRRFEPNSPAARLLERIDRIAFGAADLLVADTDADRRFFELLTPTAVEVCYVGAEERLFTPGWSPPREFEVMFVGKLIPLHGLDTILEAARRLPELRFRLVGRGQLERLLRDRPANVRHEPWIPYEDLPAALHRTGCALGIFGTTEKAQRVIPNKAFQALACATPLVTADTPAARELLADGMSALLVPPGDPDALATAIQRLAVDQGLAETLSAEGHAAYERNASETVLGARWRRLLERLVD
jgi:glycosyltransferase involved in cell wall biosynthesis